MITKYEWLYKMYALSCHSDNKDLALDILITMSKVFFFIGFPTNNRGGRETTWQEKYLSVSEKNLFHRGWLIYIPFYKEKRIPETGREWNSHKFLGYITPWWTIMQIEHIKLLNTHFYRALAKWLSQSSCNFKNVSLVWR